MDGLDGGKNSYTLMRWGSDCVHACFFAIIMRVNRIRIRIRIGGYCTRAKACACMHAWL